MGIFIPISRFTKGGKAKHPRARNDYDEEAAYESYMNPEPGLQSGPGAVAVAEKTEEPTRFSI